MKLSKLLASIIDPKPSAEKDASVEQYELAETCLGIERAAAP